MVGDMGVDMGVELLPDIPALREATTVRCVEDDTGEGLAPKRTEPDDLATGVLDMLPLATGRGEDGNGVLMGVTAVLGTNLRELIGVE